MPAERKTPVRALAESYWRKTDRPLNCLVFILPLLAAYEAGSVFFHDGLLVPAQLKALLEWCQVPSQFVPAVLIVVVLLAWHIKTGQKWRVDGDALAGMALESMLWTVPLVCMAMLTEWLIGALPLRAGPAQAALAARVLTAIGAGIYEEFLFRLAMIGLFLGLTVDLLRAPERTMAVLAVITSSVLFSLYHYVGPEAFRWDTFAFRALAGMMLAGIFVTRGFGIAVGSHACYNIFLLMA